MWMLLLTGESLAMDDGRSEFVVLLLRDPLVLESRHRSQDGATDPDGVLSLRWGNNIYLHVRWSQSSHLLLHTISDTRKQGVATGQDDVGVQVLTDVDIALHDRIDEDFVDSNRFLTKEVWLKESLWTTESFVTDGDDSAVGNLVRFLQRGRQSSSSHLLFEVESNIAELLLNITDKFTFGCKKDSEFLLIDSKTKNMLQKLLNTRGGEEVATFSQDPLQVVSEVTTSQIQTENTMGHSITWLII